MSENLVIIRRPTHDGSFEVLTGEKQRGTFSGKTVFPGGKMERGESQDTAAIREVAEETGINLEMVRRLGWLYVHNHGDEEGRGRHITIYGAEVPAGTQANDTLELVNSWRPIDDESLTDNMPADVKIWWDIVREKLPNAGWNQVNANIRHNKDGTMQVLVRYPDFAEHPNKNKFLRYVTFPPAH
jgi:8-oxo-dGTP diphosphatase